MSIALTILSFLLLFAPLVLELFDDAKGDKNKVPDVLFRLIASAAAAAAGQFMSDRNIFAGFFLSLAIHFMFFDYLINIILYKNGVINNANWFSYGSKK